MTFHQEGQKVNRQYNAAGDMYFGEQSKEKNFTELLKTFKQQLNQAREQGILDEDASTDVDYHITKALQQATKPQPDKKSILDYLGKAQKIVEGIASAGALTASIVQIIGIAQRIF
ncbi:MAG TPA: hypothetical protein VFN23_15500 [Ktedonobacteraceae bacterium]|nr:hypothetical protein [Ktedonobacteraceae bacterium]